MTIANKNIIDTYAKLFDGLDTFKKLELIDRLSKSLNNEKDSTETTFFASFGSFPGDKPVEKIISGIGGSRKF